MGEMKRRKLAFVLWNADEIDDHFRSVCHCCAGCLRVEERLNASLSRSHQLVIRMRNSLTSDVPAFNR
jgi:hypothetical protein